MANFLEILYGPTMFTAKYVVLKQIEDIFYRHRRQTLASKVIWGLIGANLIFYAALFFAFIFACVPRDKIANPLLPGRCIDTNASIIATSAINVVSDLTILLIPLAAVSHLQLPARTKIGVAGVFAVGVL
ncbi:hypothetical protein GGR56DRAFT_620761 [Xylariaceae sp. FL0804]|nr:hypothetical protein GGR56DRAFT_620761 [Xylariaceae sp. FL0804]